MYIWIHIYTYAYMNAYIYTCTHMYIFIHIYVFIYICSPFSFLLLSFPLSFFVFLSTNIHQTFMKYLLGLKKLRVFLSAYIMPVIIQLWQWKSATAFYDYDIIYLYEQWKTLHTAQEIQKGELYLPYCFHGLSSPHYCSLDLRKPKV
jgi:hypothetical protein